jgi:membrane-associated phospholipid phosphatase
MKWTILHFVTDFGDQAVLLPLAVGIGLILAVLRWRSAAFAWTIAVGGSYFTMLLLKLCCIACGHLLPGHVYSPSGHVAAATVVYGGLFTLFMRLVYGRHSRWLLLPCVIGIALVISITRVLLGAHTITEVVIGAMVGFTGALVLIALIGPPPPKLRIGWVTGLVCIVLLLCHGFRMPAETIIQDAAMKLWPFSACHASFALNLRG